MAKPPTKDLFLLVKSLSKTEKGYVRKFAFTHDGDDANFIRLFKAIDHQDEYDEAALIRSEEYISQLPRMKIYLYEFILDTLANYYSKRNAYLHIRQIINRIAILFEKGLYDACIKQLLKAKELSNRFEYFNMVLDTLQWERILMIEKQLLTDFSRIEKEEQVALAKLEELHWYNTSYRKISELYSKVIYIRSKEDDRKFKALLPANKFQNENAASSLQAKILLLKSKAKYLSALGDLNTYLKISIRAVEMMEKNSHFIMMDVLQYIKGLNNVIVALSETKHHKEFNIALDKLENLPLKYESAATDRIQSLIKLRVVTRRFYNHKFHNEFELANDFIPEFEKRIGENKHMTSDMHRIFFMYSIAYVNFIMKDYRSALTITSNIINETGKKDMKMFFVYAKLLQVTIHYELNNPELLESLTRSLLRFLENDPKNYSLERSFLKFISRKMNKNRAGDQNELKKFLEEAELKVKAYDHIILEYFDFIAWIKSKIRKTSFREQLK